MGLFSLWVHWETWIDTPALYCWLNINHFVKTGQSEVQEIWLIPIILLMSVISQAQRSKQSSGQDGWAVSTANVDSWPFCGERYFNMLVIVKLLAPFSQKIHSLTCGETLKGKHEQLPFYRDKMNRKYSRELRESQYLVTQKNNCGQSYWRIVEIDSCEITVKAMRKWWSQWCWISVHKVEACATVKITFSLLPSAFYVIFHKACVC